MKIGYLLNYNLIQLLRKSFNLDDDLKINNKYIGNILGYNTPRLTINDEFIRTSDSHQKFITLMVRLLMKIMIIIAL